LLNVKYFATLLPLVIATSCGGAKSTTTQASATLSQPEMVDLCVTLHTKAAACPAEFARLNMGLREQYSPEFAAAMKDPEMRKQVEAEGAAETNADAANAKERCTEFAQPQWGPAAQRSDLARLDACYAEASCDAKMACLRPIIEPRFAYRAAHRGGPH
jgi:hypothetical protein